MLCPICDIELKMSERKGIEIDYCPKCRGVWLDRGELDKIIERTNDDLEHSNKESYKPSYRTEYHRPDMQYEKRKNDYKSKKRKSVLEDIFDIFD
ncbi:MAG: zf-TFIIB domain-containing protein [Phototrophicaceae bacterium]